MKLAGTRLGMGPERPPGARLVCEPPGLPVVLVFAEEVITRCNITLCRLRDSASHTSHTWLLDGHDVCGGPRG